MKWKAKMAWKPGDEWCMRPEEDADILYWCSGFWLRNYSHYWKYMAENEKPVLCLLLACMMIKIMKCLITYKSFLNFEV
jgi:hypothetical protein